MDITGWILMFKSGRGALIVFEGCDRSGKSTQARRIAEKISDLRREVEVLNFPDRSTDLGKFIDRYLKKEVEMESKEAHLVFSANRHAIAHAMEEKLKNGIHLIVDRYMYSGIAYTMAKDSFNMGLEWAKLHDTGLIKPDCVIFFDLIGAEAGVRSDFGSERFETVDFQIKVYETMKVLQNEEQHLWKNVNASMSFEEVTEAVWKILQPILNSVGGSPIRYVNFDRKT